MTDYSKNIIKKYRYWTVYACADQCYLGRCVIWCDREAAHDLTEASLEEQAEFFKIISALKSALQKSFSPDWMNYSFLGNELKHLHCHMVPRYKKMRKFNGVIFQDERYKKGLNWLADESFVTSDSLIQAVKRKVQENLD